MAADPEAELAAEVEVCGPTVVCCPPLLADDPPLVIEPWVWVCCCPCWALEPAVASEEDDCWANEADAASVRAKAAVVASSLCIIVVPHHLG